MKENSDSRARFACRRTLRLSAEENERLARQADAAGNLGFGVHPANFLRRQAHHFTNGQSDYPRTPAAGWSAQA